MTRKDQAKSKMMTNQKRKRVENFNNHKYRILENFDDENDFNDMERALDSIPEEMINKPKDLKKYMTDLIKANGGAEKISAYDI